METDVQRLPSSWHLMPVHSDLGTECPRFLTVLGQQKNMPRCSWSAFCPCWLDQLRTFHHPEQFCSDILFKGRTCFTEKQNIESIPNLLTTSLLMSEPVPNAPTSEEPYVFLFLSCPCLLTSPEETCKFLRKLKPGCDSEMLLSFSCSEAFL